MKKILQYNLFCNGFVDPDTAEILTPTNNEILYFCDMFDINIIKNIDCAAVVCDVECTVLENFHAPLLFIPSLKVGMETHVNQMQQACLTNTDEIDELVTENCFCWSINRKSLDRYLTIKLIEWFGLDSYKYTWSGVEKFADCSFLIEEFNKIDASWMTEKFRSFILAPITIKKHFIFTELTLDLELVEHRFVGSRKYQWEEVQSKIATTSSVYLLTESFTNFEKNYTFTEKTGYALTAKNFLIWAGNYGQAEQAKRMGIDTFDDVINHNYQWYDTVTERCYYAIADNIKILTDLEYARSQRQQCHDRLIKNQHWFLKDGLNNYINNQLEKFLDIAK